MSRHRPVSLCHCQWTREVQCIWVRRMLTRRTTMLASTWTRPPASRSRPTTLTASTPPCHTLTRALVLHTCIPPGHPDVRLFFFFLCIYLAHLISFISLCRPLDGRSMPYARLPFHSRTFFPYSMCYYPVALIGRVLYILSYVISLTFRPQSTYTIGQVQNTSGIGYLPLICIFVVGVCIYIPSIDELTLTSV